MQHHARIATRRQLACREGAIHEVQIGRPRVLVEAERQPELSALHLEAGDRPHVDEHVAPRLVVGQLPLDLELDDVEQLALDAHPPP